MVWGVEGSLVWEMKAPLKQRALEEVEKGKTKNPMLKGKIGNQKIVERSWKTHCGHLLST